MKTFLVTGANSGVGFEVARGLVAAGHGVVLAVRDGQRGEAAMALLRREHPAAEVKVVTVDLSDLASVRGLEVEGLALDGVVNNAGIAFEPLRLTAERVHAQFATNHLGHFVLTAQLLPALERRPEARVVTVASTIARRGKFVPAEVDGTGFSSARAYAQSKLANVFFGVELDRRLRARSSRVRSVLCHPGLPATPMQQKARGPIGWVVRSAAAVFGKPPAVGAAAVLEALLGSVEGGVMVGPGPRVEPVWPSMRDVAGTQALWELSERISGQSLR
jgi:NAD(P)-dependent dehydrogenase (short-subunit alcohol dehydrogenase family)